MKPKPDEKGKDIFHARDYKDRNELDMNILTILGDNFEKNKGTAIIKGSKEKLKELHLSEDTTVWDVTVKVT